MYYRLDVVTASEPVGHRTASWTSRGPAAEALESLEFRRVGVDAILQNEFVSVAPVGRPASGDLVHASRGRVVQRRVVNEPARGHLITRCSCQLAQRARWMSRLPPPTLRCPHPRREPPLRRA